VTVARCSKCGGEVARIDGDRMVWRFATDPPRDTEATITDRHFAGLVEAGAADPLCYGARCRKRYPLGEVARILRNAQRRGKKSVKIPT
jgi:hypothetical protein